MPSGVESETEPTLGRSDVPEPGPAIVLVEDEP